MILPAEHPGGGPPARQPARVDTANHFMVGMQDSQIVILNPPVGRKLTKSEAINLAAWLIVLTGGAEEFARVFAEIKKT